MREESLPVQVIMIGRFIYIWFMIRFRLVDRRYKDSVDIDASAAGWRRGHKCNFILRANVKCIHVRLTGVVLVEGRCGECGTNGKGSTRCIRKTQFDLIPLGRLNMDIR
jgi:hypothetical protein